MFTKALLKVDSRLILLLMTAGYQACRRFRVANGGRNPELCSAQLQELQLCCVLSRSFRIGVTKLFDLPRNWSAREVGPFVNIVTLSAIR